MEYTVLATRRHYTLLTYTDDSGQLFALAEDGVIVSRDTEGDDFRERVGFVSAEWELFLGSG